MSSLYFMSISTSGRCRRRLQTALAQRMGHREPALQCDPKPACDLAGNKDRRNEPAARQNNHVSGEPGRSCSIRRDSRLAGRRGPERTVQSGHPSEGLFLRSRHSALGSSRLGSESLCKRPTSMEEPPKRLDAVQQLWRERSQPIISDATTSRRRQKRRIERVVESAEPANGDGLTLLVGGHRISCFLGLVMMDIYEA